MPDISIKNIYALMDKQTRDASKRKFQVSLVDIFPYLDIHSDIYLLSEDILKDFDVIKVILKEVSSFLKGFPFYRINIHPVHPLPPEDPFENIYNTLFTRINLFNNEGYLHQGVSRIMILPILILKERNDLQFLHKYMNYLRERMMIPSVYIPGDFPLSIIKDTIRSDKERIYLKLTQEENLRAVLYTLGVHTVFDNIMTWANAPIKGPLFGCRSVVLSEKDGNAYSCFRAMVPDRSVAKLYSKNIFQDFSNITETDKKKGSDCKDCYDESFALMEDTLKVNDRQKDADSISFHLGMELINQKDYRRALKNFNRLLEKNKGFEDKGALLLSKALCHLRMNEITKASSALDEAEKHIPSSAMLQYYRGLCEFGLRDYIEAIDRFHDALKLQSEELPLGDLYFYMGLSHINIEEYDDGLTMMNLAESFFTNKSPIYYYMGICNLGMQNLAFALEHLKKALGCGAQYEDLGSIQYHLGLCYKEMERYSEAIIALKRAKEAEPERKDIYNLMGFCYFKLKEHDQAIECFKKAIEIDPKSAIDYANIGVNLKEKGEIKKAIPMFQKALSLDPTIGFARKHLNEIGK
ncbi:MAG: tetratricopeptide repeat protein [Thermodesulfobacteriota bacterium]|nr:tetratricopeptide repeat protein [Thermodesulfobacteriota bacterium]